MMRTFTISVLAVLASAALPAQDRRAESVAEIKIERSLSPDSDGVADLLPATKADRLILNYLLRNNGPREMEIGRVAVYDQVNCDVAITRGPGSQVGANGDTTMILDLRPQDQGTFSFTVTMAVDGREYSFPVQATVTALLHTTVSAHSHNDDDDHCSTGVGGSWLLVAGAAAILGTLALRRRAA